MKKINIILFVILLITNLNISCSNKNKKKASELMNEVKNNIIEMGGVPSSKRDTIMYMKSIFLIKKAIKLDPDNVGYYKTLGNLYRHIDSLEVAMQYINKVLKLNKKDTMSLLYKAMLLDYFNKKDSAEYYYNNVLNLYSNSNKFWDRMNIALIHYLLYGKEEGLSKFKELEKSFPDKSSKIFFQQLDTITKKDLLKSLVH